MGAQQTIGSLNPMAIARAVLAALIAAAFIGLVVMLAAVLTATALVIAGLGALGAAAYWLYRKVAGKKREDGPVVLIAKRGPRGWTVDGTGEE